MKRLIFFLAVVLLFQTSQAQNGWFSKTTFPGTPRAGAAGFVIGNDIYVGAGFKIDTPQINIYLNDFWKYNIPTDTWSPIDSLPVNYGLGNACSFAINGKGYVFGGIADSMGQFINPHVWEYDTSTSQWLQKNDVPFNPEFNNPSFAIDNYGYVNLPNLFYNSIYKYDPSVDIWTLMTDTFASNVLWSIYGSSSISDSTKGYVFGGTGASVSNCQWFDQIFSFNSNTNIWSFNSPPIHFDTCYSNGFLFLIDSAFYMGNGSANPSGNWWGTYYDRIFKYNLSDSTLTQLTSFPFGQSTASNYFTIDNCGYLICGAGGMNGNRTLLFCPDSLTSVNEINYPDLISISPNPVLSNFHIQSIQPVSKIVIYNFMLQSVFNFNANESKQLEFNIANFDSGIYFIQIISGSFNTSVIKKLIKL